ncbi:thiol reductant ABC exporter subunit CydD [Luteimicrobium subarcticum]|uniref:ATP-binding cassette subfamily C protein CydD n=1 Tax=Luteimicrobium subarcticum TaxID=620910 RepID=A0A2M8WQV5_9MICO|nr:thiol reductant ABC exporter subunit CydD [Luteimicrobium subarcticum]PJI93274.1 ATP-binding cassette subfamily C protein CydD [Luteimicrobium subarcticum]
MKPLDPRLLRYARAARTHLALTTVLGAVAGVLVVAQALLLASALAAVVHDGVDLPAIRGRVGWLAGVVAARAAVAWCQERFAVRAARTTVGELREAVVQHTVALGPRWRASPDAAGVATLVTRGLDDLEPYFVRYVPQLLLTAVVTPLLVVVTFGLDWVSGVIVVVTLPLVPLFMVLVGRLTEGAAERRLRTLARLGDQLLDLVAGLPTLRAFGRAAGPRARVRELGEANRRATTATLRYAFLSGMVLELLTTLSVAIVAVGIGLRLVDGRMDLFTGLAVLVLAPEVYLPLRQVGAQFHASRDGIAAASAAFEVLELPVPARRAGGVRVDLTRAVLVLEDVDVEAPGRDLVAPSGLDLAVAPGEAVALVGPNGAGKSTAVQVLLGLVAPTRGRVVVRPVTGGPSGTDRDPVGPAQVDLSDVDLDDLWRQVAWVPQRPTLGPGTLADVVEGTSTVDPRPPADAARRGRAARATGLDAVVAALPDGWATPLGRGGLGLSVGQSQRVALTTALLRDVPLVVLDEPTAHLDAASERDLVAAVRALRDDGRTVVVVAHRPALVAACDRVVDVRSAVVRATGAPAAVA